jgi:CubicO group peptidase (beta-lactamase class C family)
VELGLSAGLTGGRSQGWETGATLPSPVQVLNGEAPAHNEPVQRRRAPGHGLLTPAPNTLVVQQAMAETTGGTFPGLKSRLLFRPLGMAGSSFAQPSADDRTLATGHLQDASPLKREIPGGVASGRQPDRG